MTESTVVVWLAAEAQAVPHQDTVCNKQLVCCTGEAVLAFPLSSVVKAHLSLPVVS